MQTEIRVLLSKEKHAHQYLQFGIGAAYAAHIVAAPGFGVYICQGDKGS